MGYSYVNMLRIYAFIFLCLASSQAKYTEPNCNGKQIIVHLFEWSWDAIGRNVKNFWVQKDFVEFRFHHQWNISKEDNGGQDINQFHINSNPDPEIEINSSTWSTVATTLE